MTILQHRDYQGDVKFDGENLVIRILHIDDFITTQVDRASEAQAAFAELVDDYIETCEEVGKPPNKPFKGSFNVRMSPTLHRQAAFAAAAMGETLNSFVVNAIEEQLKASEIDKGVAQRMTEYAMLHHSHARQEAHSAWQAVSAMDIDTMPLAEIHTLRSIFSERPVAPKGWMIGNVRSWSRR